ncbi:MAG TPA: transglycosylase domain-containing protein [Flavobacterium sp.]|jgi:hypothetical protein
MTSKKRKKIFIFLISFITIIAILITAFFVYRNDLLQKAIARATTKLDVKYDCNFSVKEAHFEGFSHIHLSEVILAPKKNDTLLKIQKMRTSVSFWHLLFGDVQLGTLEINNGFIQLVKNERGKNFEAFLKKNKAKTNLPKQKKDYAAFTYDLLSTVLNLVPTDMDVKNLVLIVNDNGKKAQIDFQQLLLKNKDLESAIKVQTNTFTQRWSIKGFADPRNNKADIQFVNLDTGAIKIPYVDESFNLQASFNTARLNIDDIDIRRGKLHIDGFSSISNLKINHPKIAGKDVVIKAARFDYNLVIGADFIDIDSSSVVQLNKIKFHPYVSVSTASDTIYKLNVVIPKMKAQDFIVSLPDGLFTHFQGMQALGNFEFKMNFEFNKNKPDRLIFNSDLNKENLKIIKYGDADLTKLNGEFVYRAIIKDIRQRPIYVGESNPNYVTLNEISPYLRKCVLTTEDPSFFSHKGFVNEAFKQSIVQNIKTKKFSRGASTISMQLIKNVFLTREKTLSRKLEEILLVYILENNRISRKERMLEVYFNIIEWGPNVYGIGEASRFYFQKHPADLNLNECLFLANIIPRPKKFMYQFNDQGSLKGYAVNKQNYIKSLMIKRGIISPEDDYDIPVSVTGPAKSYIKIRVLDTIPEDTLSLDEEFNF